MLQIVGLCLKVINKIEVLICNFVNPLNIDSVVFFSTNDWNKEKKNWGAKE